MHFLMGRIEKQTSIIQPGRFDNIDSGVIISIVSKAVQKSFCTALLTLQMMTAESMLSQCPVLGIIVTLFILLIYPLFILLKLFYML